MLQKNSNTEQIILETAERMFLEKGFAMTSTTDIAKEVGCNQAMVHYYFRTKEKLFESIFEKKIKLFASPFLQVQANDENLTFEVQLKKLIEAHFDIIKANPRIPFFLFNELLTNPNRLESFAKKVAEVPLTVLSKIGEELDVEIEKGTIRPMNTIELLLTILSLNITPFIMIPVFKKVINISDSELDRIIDNRKHENVHIILRSLKP